VPLLGLRCSFGFPESSGGIHEFDLPYAEAPDVLARLESRGGLSITRHEGRSEDENLLNHLRGGGSAIVGVDAFHLPFRPAYGRVHSCRSVLVRGLESQGDDGQFEVLDGWRPSSTGVIGRDTLERARFSEVTREGGREPLFSGHPVQGVWFAVRELPPVERMADSGWIERTLGTVVREAGEDTRHPAGRCGPGALHAFGDHLERLLADPDGEIAARRDAVLLLRPELSSRLYFCAFLRCAAAELGDPLLATTERRYRDRLGHLQAAIDVLTKTLRTGRAVYDAFAVDQFRSFVECEAQALADLSWYAREPYSP